MILYYAPGACSLADPIALIEANLPYTLIRIDRTKRTEDGRDFLTINPRGFVPALELNDGSVLTENLAVLAYIANCGDALFGGGGMTHWRGLEAISFMSAGIHGNLVPFFKGRSNEEKGRARRALEKSSRSLADQLGDRPFLLGERLTIADPYLFWALRSAPISEVVLPKPLQAYFSRLTVFGIAPIPTKPRLCSRVLWQNPTTVPAPLMEPC